MTLWCCMAGQHILAFTESKSEHVNESVWCNQTYKLLLLFQPQCRKCLDTVYHRKPECHHFYPPQFCEVLLSLCSYIQSFRQSCVLQSGEPQPVFFVIDLSFQGLFHIQSWYFHLWTCLPVECSKQMFWSIPHLSQSFVAPVQISLNHIAGIKFRISICWQNNDDVDEVKPLNILSGWANSVLFMFYTVSQLFGNGGVASIRIWLVFCKPSLNLWECVWKLEDSSGQCNALRDSCHYCLQGICL